MACSQKPSHFCNISWLLLCTTLFHLSDKAVLRCLDSRKLLCFGIVRCRDGNVVLMRSGGLNANNWNRSGKYFEISAFLHLNREGLSLNAKLMSRAWRTGQVSLIFWRRRQMVENCDFSGNLLTTRKSADLISIFCSNRKHLLRGTVLVLFFCNNGIKAI